MDAESLGLRIGHGYDLHRLAPFPGPDERGRPVRPLIVGGVSLEHDRGIVAHSDGDALYHAVTDALLSAIGGEDIGRLFPDTDPRHAGEDSSVYLAEAARRAREQGWVVVNVSATVVLERPKVATHARVMAANMARLLGVDATRAHVKGKTHEGVDAVGEGRAIEVHAVALLARAGE